MTALDPSEGVKHLEMDRGKVAPNAENDTLKHRLNMEEVDLQSLFGLHVT